MKLRDIETAVHSYNVACYCEHMAKGLDLGNPIEYFVGGLLHDIGKIAMPDSILKSSEKLSIEGRKLLVRHVIDGERVLEELAFSSVVINMAKLHHERFDGNGYLGIHGSELPIESRVISICDSYDAIMSNRSYAKKVGGQTEAIKIIRNSSGQFDPQLVDEFINMLTVEPELGFGMVGS